MTAPAATPPAPPGQRGAVCVGGPVHGLVLFLPETTREVYPIVFVLSVPPADTLPEGESAGYHPRPVQLLGRVVAVQWHNDTPYAPAALAAAIFNKDGQALYDLGWGASKPEPTGGGSVLAVWPDEPAVWVEVDEVAAPVIWRDKDGVPAATGTNLPLLDRWVRLAVPPAVARRPRRGGGTWLDAALANAILTNDGVEAWERGAPG